MERPLNFLKLDRLKLLHSKNFQQGLIQDRENPYTKEDSSVLGDNALYLFMTKGDELMVQMVIAHMDNNYYCLIYSNPFRMS